MAKKPESKIQAAMISMLEGRGWHCENMHGNAFQRGIPDLYVHHPTYKERWIDAKVEGKYEFTRDQILKWPVWDKAGIGIWILTGHDQEQYDRLFGPPNWKDYWKPRYDKILNADLDAFLDAIDLDLTPVVMKDS